MFCIKNNQKGFAAFFITFLILAVVFSITISIAILTVGQEKIARNIVRSSQAYFVAEAGIEDAVYRIKKPLNVPPSYTLAVSDDSANIIVDSPNPKTRIITASSDVNNVSRKLKTYLSVNAVTPQFFYGVQAGDLGIEMENNSKVKGIDETGGEVPGNVYSNGTVQGSNGAEITGTVIVAMESTATSLNKVSVLGDAYANTINDSEICGDAYYQTIDGDSLAFLNNPSGCSPYTPGIAYPGSPNKPLGNMPISDSNINDWKEGAADEEIYSGDYIMNSDEDLGPLKINGNLIFGTNDITLTIKGTLYVTGYIDFDATNARMQCAPSYGENSCVVIVDKWVYVKNNASFSGSGASNSYILILSTSNCDGTPLPDCADDNSAIYVKNNAEGAIFYAQNGQVTITNNVRVTELTGRKILLKQDAWVIYEEGLVSAGFSSGPGGGWVIDSWKETEE